MHNRKLLALILTIIITVMSGCTSVGEGDSSSPDSHQTAAGTKGRYVETDVTPENADIMKMVRLSDGTVKAFGKGLKEIYTSSDNGKTWERSEGPGAIDESLIDAVDIAVFADGTIILSVGDRMSDKPMELKKISTDGTVSSFTVPEYEKAVADKGYTYITSFEAVGSDKLLLGWMSGGMAYSNEGEEDAEEESPEKEEAESKSFSSADMGGKTSVFDVKNGDKLYDLAGAQNISRVLSLDDKMYLVDYDGGISVRGIEDGKEISKIDAGNTDFSIDSASFTMDYYSVLGDKIYIINNKGIDAVGLDGGKRERLIGSAGFSFGSSDSGFSDCMAVSDKEFLYLITNSEDKNVIKRLSYDADATVNSEKSIKVWSLEENRTIRAAILKYQSDNPDALVEYEVALGNEGGITKEDAIKNLNTRILAGEGPDVIALDGMQPDSYANKGMLSDLSGVLDTSDVYEKFISEAKTEDKLYYLPTRFKVPMVLSGEGESVPASLTEFADAVTEGADKPAMDPENPFAQIAEDQKPLSGFSDFEEIFSLLWQSGQNAVTSEGKINADNLKALAENAKKITDKYKIFSDTESMGMAMAISSGGGGEIISGSYMSYINAQVVLGVGTMGSVDISASLPSDTKFTLFPGLDKGSFTPVDIFGVNSKSTKQEASASFLQTMLSLDVQGSNISGFPVTKAGIHKWQTMPITMYTSDASGAPKKVEITPWVKLEEMIAGLKSPVYLDSTLKDIISEKTEEYCRGNIELESYVEEVENGAKNYLAEQAY